VWAANVRAANAKLRNDQQTVERWTVKPAYRATELH
jgi:hypothetical protein